MSYDTLMAALSPWGYWKTNETSGTTLADSSGNSRPLTTFSSPTLAQTGPDGSTADAISWTNTAGQTAATQSATTTAGAFTHIIWFYLTANPSGNLGVMTRALDYATSGAADGEFYISSDGKPHFRVFSGSAQVIDGASAVSLNTWHMAVASVGAAGMKLRIDKTTVASNAGITSAFTGASQKIIIRGGGTNFTNTSAIKTSRPAYITSQISDASGDGLYDSLSTLAAAGAASLSLSASGAAASTAVGSAALVLSAQALIGQPASGTAALSLSAPSAASGGAAGSASLSLSGSGSAQLAAAGAAFLTFGSTGAAAPLYTTDLSNAFTGLSLSWTAQVFSSQQVAEPPFTANTYCVDKAVALPDPVLVKGRPT